MKQKCQRETSLKIRMSHCERHAHTFESSAHEMSPFTVNLHVPDWSITLKPQNGRRHTCLLYTGKEITTAFACNNVAIL